VLLAPQQKVAAIDSRERKGVFLTFINTDQEVIISGDKETVCNRCLTRCHAISDFRFKI